MHIQIQWFAINQFRQGGDGLAREADSSIAKILRLLF